MDVYRTVWIAETGRHELYRLSLAGTYRLDETRRDENPQTFFIRLTGTKLQKDNRKLVSLR